MVGSRILTFAIPPPTTTISAKRKLDIPRSTEFAPCRDEETPAKRIKDDRKLQMYNPWIPMVVEGKSVQTIRRIDFQYGCDKFGIYDDGSFQFDKAFSAMNIMGDIDRVNLSKLDAMNAFFQTYVARYLLIDKFEDRPTYFYLQKYQRNQLVWVKLNYCSFTNNDLSETPTVVLSIQTFDVSTYYQGRREIGPEVVNGFLYKHHPRQVYERTD